MKSSPEGESKAKAGSGANSTSWVDGQDETGHIGFAATARKICTILCSLQMLGPGQMIYEVVLTWGRFS